MKSVLGAILVLLFCACPALAKDELSAFERRVESLRGYWFSTSGPANRREVLHVANVLDSRGNRARLVAKWGGALKPWRDAREAAATESGERLLLEVTSPGSRKAWLEYQSGDILSGHVIAPDGTRKPLTLARSTLPQIHEWIATNPLPEFRAGRDSPVELVYLTAANCPSCRAWELHYLDNHAPKAALGWDGVKFSAITRASFRAPVHADDFPDALKPQIVRYLKERGWSYFQGTPQWVLFVNGQVRAYSWGTGNFDTLIHPAIRAALAEKRSG